LIASQRPFKAVVGVEFCEELHEIALANVSAFPLAARASGEVDLVCVDAAKFTFPHEPLVLYFYNPFLESLMRKVMSNLIASLKQAPRPVFVVMTGDQSLGKVVVEAGFVTVGDGVFTNTRP
jgi:hypothetical protein